MQSSNAPNMKNPEQSLRQSILRKPVMTALYPDTHPKMEALQIRLWRQASPTRKMNMLAQLNRSARTLALTGLRTQFPHASKAELHFKLAILLLGEEMARKVYGG